MILNMTTKTNEMWSQLLAEGGDRTGLLVRRCPAEVVPNIFFAISLPDESKCLAVSTTDAVNFDITAVANLRDIAVEISTDGPNAGQNFIIIRLTDRTLEEIFGVLCDDLIDSVKDTADEQELAAVLIARLNQWAALFERATTEGLSSESQRGLYGELYLLRLLVGTGCDSQLSLEAWLGPSGGVRDFQWGNSAIEVKTTHGNNHQRIRISSERQLDPSNLESLFLYHLSIETLQNASETLNELVDELLGLLSPFQNSFKAKLFQYGYFDHHRHLYESHGYRIRASRFYDVRSEFPRIEEGDLRSGVGDVTYSIVISQFSDFLVTEDEVISRMNLR